MNNLSHLLLTYSTYVTITASPGPGNLAIMTTSMNHGRRAGIALAGGVIAGSQCWGISAAIGVSSIVTKYPIALRAIAILGGFYFLWLAYKAVRAAFENSETKNGNGNGDDRPLRYYFLRGFGVHIFNPKAILGWISIIALGVDATTPAYTTFIIVFGCFVLGATIFGIYAVAFSTQAVINFYQRTRKFVQIFTALLFATVGALMLLTSY